MIIPLLLGISVLLEMYAVLPVPVTDMCFCSTKKCRPQHKTLIAATSGCHLAAAVLLGAIYIGLCINTTGPTSPVSFVYYVLLLAAFLATLVPTIMLCTEMNQPGTGICRSSKEEKLDVKPVLHEGFTRSTLFLAGTAVALALVIACKKE